MSGALEQVLEITGVSEKEILSIKRGPGGNPARVLAVWWLVYGAGLTNSEVGQSLSMSSSAVSKILKKLRDRPADYLGGQIEYWQRLLKNKGQ